MNTIHAFRSLGDRVDAAWTSAGRKVEAFPDIAQSCLQESELLTQGDPWEVPAWLLKGSEVVHQDGYEFGEPAITVYHASDFFIQVLFWLDGSPNVHEHGFDGVFGVFHGSSVHSDYIFNSDELPNQSRAVLVGHLQCRQVELLKQGDTRLILSSGRPHGLFHLDYPSVSVVIRTLISTTQRPQYCFLRPYLALDPEHRCGNDSIKLGTLQMLAKTRWSQFRAELPVIFTGETDWFKLNLFRWFLNFRGDEALQLLQASGVQRDIRTLRILASALEERRIQRILAIRQAIRSPDHRRLLAFLSNSGDRNTLLSLVGMQFPGKEPVPLIVRWIAEIMRDIGNGIVVEPEDLLQIEQSLMPGGNGGGRSGPAKAGNQHTMPAIFKHPVAAGIFESLFR
jgi:hypothetical protein